MQKAVFFPLSRRFQGRFQTDHFPFEHLVVVAALNRILLKEPASGSGDGDVFIFIAVIIKNPQIGKLVFFAKTIEFCGCCPPVIMIPFQNDFSSGNFVDEGKILPCRVQPQRPGQVAEQDSRILRADDRKSRSELFEIAFPHSSENIHRFIGSEGQMQITDCIKCHPFLPLQYCQ